MSLAEAKPVNEEALPDDIKALLARSKKIRSDFHGVDSTAIEPPTPEKKELPKEEVKVEQSTEPVQTPEPISEPPVYESEEKPLDEDKSRIIALEDAGISIELDDTEVEESIPVEREQIVFSEPVEINLDEGFELDDSEEAEFEESVNLVHDEISVTPIQQIDESVQEDNLEDKSSFSSWLRHLEVEDESLQTEESFSLDLDVEQNIEEAHLVDAERDQKIELIDKFLESRPKIRPNPAGVAGPNLAELSSSENTHLITETLAEVYVAQGHFGRAIEAYEILGLKYPEKSGFFADRIREIKKRK